MEALKRVPPIVWGLLVPALIIGAVQLRRPDGRRVHVVGAGYAQALTDDDEADDSFFYDLEMRPHEPVAATVTRTRALLQHWPRVVVVAFDVASIDGNDEAAARLQMRALVAKLESVQAVPVILPLRAQAADAPEVHTRAQRLDPWFRTTLCQTGKLRRCVAFEPGATAPADWKSRVQAAVAAAVRFQSTLPSAQIGH